MSKEKDTAENAEVTDVTDVEAMKKRIKELVAENRKVTEKLKAKETPAQAADNTAKAKVPKENPWQKLVKIMLFKDNDKYKSDMFVCVNGRRFQIRRGVEVAVPLPIYKAIRESEKQDQKAANLMEELSAKYKE